MTPAERMEQVHQAFDEWLKKADPLNLFATSHGFAREAWQDALLSYQPSAVPHTRKGWTLVPIEPTAAMIDAAVHCLDGLNLHKEARPATAVSRCATKAEISMFKVCRRWWAMLGAAPQVPGNSGADGEGAVSPVVTGEPLSPTSPIATPAGAASVRSASGALSEAGIRKALMRNAHFDDLAINELIRLAKELQ
jgi:hypothetical protein